MADALKTILRSKLARPGQPLSQHINAVSSMAAQFGEKCGIEEMTKLAGFFHDLGKATDDFQEILNAPRRSIKVPHSIFGAKRLHTDTMSLQHIAEIFSNIIMSHHGSLNDYISPEGDTPVADKIEAAEPFPSAEGCPEISLSRLNAEFTAAIGKMHVEDKAFALSMLIKLAYSCLVDADRLDAYLHENNEKQPLHQPDWEGMLQSLQNHLTGFTSSSEMAVFRQQISNQCAEAGQRERGVYKLEVPTGGGKTMASLRFALVHAMKHKLDRIILVIPYLSILDQTANEIRKALKADDATVLEHHSGFLPDNPEYYKLQTNRWDAPIILTTQVQFLESLFSARGSDLRKLHNMANSVMIFDEAQSLPVKCVHLFNGAINFLNRVCGATVLLCTATQPLLDTVERKLRFSGSPSIAKVVPLAKRTSIVNAIRPEGYTCTQLATFVKEKHKSSTLVIVNTKAAAKSLYEELHDADVTLLHLSTNMCTAHRDDVLTSLRNMLDSKSKEPVICVSTQLIEAGVDISFECVIRDVAGLDSIYQAAGRCNRHGEFGETKDVYVINIPGENLSKLPDIKIGAEITKDLFDTGRKDDITEYYRRYFYARRGMMDYPTLDGGTIYDLLSANNQGFNAYKNRGNKKPSPLMRSAIRAAGEAFFVIDRGRKDVIVPYGEALTLIHKYSNAYDPAEKRKLLRQLQRYSVSLYRYQEEALKAAGALYQQDELTVLEKGDANAPFYNLVRGVDLNGQPEFLIV